MVQLHRPDGDLRSVLHRTDTLPNIIDEYLLDLKLANKSPLTISAYSNRLKVFCQWLVEKKLSLNIQEISKQYIKHFLLSLKERKTRSDKPVKDIVVNIYYRCLHSFFRWSVEESLISYSPMDGMHPPAYTKSEIKPFSVRDIEILLLLCQGNTFLELRNKSIILVALDTGLRLREMAGIMLNDLDLNTGYINVLGKGKKHRMVRIGVKARKVLIRYLRLRDPQHPNLWQTEEKRPLTHWGMSYAIRNLCKRAEITDTRGSPHTFRHSAAMFSLKNGAELIDVQKMLGHSKIKTTADTYLDAFNSESAAQRHVKFSPVDNFFK